VNLSTEQGRVLGEVSEWLRGTREQSAFQAPWRYLAGVAGSGKSTLLKELSREFRVAYCALTGKAASVLREKGCADATTLHKLLYRPEEKVVRAEDGQQRWSTEFVVRDDAPLAEFDAVALDECSMISSGMAQDLLSCGKPVLAVGDPHQLPPVAGEGYFSSREPHWYLGEVHRQALDSGILRLATDVREGRGILNSASYMPDAAVISLEEASAVESDLLAWTDVVIVGTHRMRHHFNNQYRAAAHRRGPLPEKGEQLVCLQNDHRRGLLNGSIWRVVGADARQVSHRAVEVLVESVDDPSQKLLVEAWDHDFLGTEDAFERMSWGQRSRRARFAYGYALTCHKFQGSQADRVLVVDESSAFREHAARWQYTAITRAAKQLVLVRR
jgi:exodeoxyribonuclease-5